MTGIEKRKHQGPVARGGEPPNLIDGQVGKLYESFQKERTEFCLSNAIRPRRGNFIRSLIYSTTFGNTPQPKP